MEAPATELLSYPTTSPSRKITSFSAPTFTVTDGRPDIGVNEDVARISLACRRTAETRNEDDGESGPSAVKPRPQDRGAVACRGADSTGGGIVVPVEDRHPVNTTTANTNNRFSGFDAGRLGEK